MTLVEVKRLRGLIRKRKEDALRRGSKPAVRDWFVVNLALFTGLRVMEIAGLKHCDLFLGNGYSVLIVRKGKNGKPRRVRFGPILRGCVEEYLEWKHSVGEPCDSDDPLVVSSNTGGAMTTRGLQKVFKRCAHLAGIFEHSIHHLRHTYASHLYKTSGYNLRLVQKQLGHSSTKITEVYADVLAPDLNKALKKLYE